MFPLKSLCPLAKRSGLYSCLFGGLGISNRCDQHPALFAVWGCALAVPGRLVGHFFPDITLAGRMCERLPVSPGRTVTRDIGGSAVGSALAPCDALMFRPWPFPKLGLYFVVISFQALSSQSFGQVMKLNSFLKARQNRFVGFAAVEIPGTAKTPSF